MALIGASGYSGIIKVSGTPPVGAGGIVLDDNFQIIK